MGNVLRRLTYIGVYGFYIVSISVTYPIFCLTGIVSFVIGTPIEWILTGKTVWTNKIVEFLFNDWSTSYDTFFGKILKVFEEPIQQNNKTTKQQDDKTKQQDDKTKQQDDKTTQRENDYKGFNRV